MHNAWLIPEVRGMILGYLAADTGTRDQSKISTTLNYTQPGAGQKALAVLARTCRTLSEFALDALWCVLPTLQLLLQCARGKDSGHDEPVPPFNEEEWNIVLRYTPRVRELAVTKSDELSIEILQSWWFPTTTLLLPNLRRLHWNREDYADFPLIRLLLSPSLLRLDVYLPMGWGGDIESFVLGFLECCHTICPQLKSLHFRHDDLNRDSLSAVAVISRAVRRFPTLEALTCHALDEEAFLHVAKSRDIKNFSACLLHHHPDILRSLAEYGTLDIPLFSNLRILHLDVCDFSTVIPYLKSHHQPLEEIFIKFLEDPSPKVFHEFFAALGSPTRQESLRRVVLRTCQPDTGYRQRVATKSAPQPTRHNFHRVGKGDTSPVHFEVLAPLVGCSLHDFELNLNNPVLLNDNDLAHLAQGWPDLETFSVTTGGKSSYFPTLMGLLHLLVRCQKLCRLKLSVDARTIPLLTLEESRMCNVVIEQLEVTPESPIEKTNVEAVAHFLLKHFPSLICVTCSTNYRFSYPEIWKMVDGQIKKIKSLRVDSYVETDSDSD